MIQLLRLLCGEQNPPWVVGDIRQAIYRFRGADPLRNLALFKQLFPDAKTFDLSFNYRSSLPIIQAANQMATLMAAPDHCSNDFRAIWQMGMEHQPFGENPVQILAATSDAAEQEGIAKLVEQWLAAGIKPDEIAILARRNIDVRNIVLALGARGIRTMTSGLITPEGAAGDLAAALTLADAPTASVPRLIYALGKGRFTSETLNEITRFLLHEQRNNKANGETQPSTGSELLAEYGKLFDCLHKQKHDGDAFTMLCAFLFDASNYLRNILNGADETMKSLALSEVITTLIRAAGYRFTHQKLPPRESRLGFAQYFRDNLSNSKPVIAAPRSSSEAVRVMTCHAAKGLEFPCVIVAGQTINNKARDWWLPLTLMAVGEEDRKQADSLLFVGITRAQRAAVITYAEAKTIKGRQRELPGLLGRWHSIYSVPLEDLPEHEIEKTTVMAKAIWGLRARVDLPVRHLDKGVCSIATYLEKFLGIGFPQALPILYPSFTVAVRRAMRRIVVQSQAEQRQITAEEASTFFLTEFQSLRMGQSPHPHQKLYDQTGATFSQMFAAAYQPHKGAVKFLHWLEGGELILNWDEELLPLRLDLVTCFQDEQGIQHALLYRRETLSINDAEVQNWSAIDRAYKRVSFVVLRQLYPAIQFRAFSGADGRLYHIKPNRQSGNMDKEAAMALENLRQFTNGRFTAQPDDYKCRECPVRISCPYWLNAMTGS